MIRVANQCIVCSGRREYRSEFLSSSVESNLHSENWSPVWPRLVSIRLSNISHTGYHQKRKKGDHRSLILGHTDPFFVPAVCIWANSHGSRRRSSLTFLHVWNIQQGLIFLFKENHCDKPKKTLTLLGNWGDVRAAMVTTRAYGMYCGKCQSLVPNLATTKSREQGAGTAGTRNGPVEHTY